MTARLQVRGANPSTEIKDLFGAGGVKVLDKDSGKVECIVSVTGVQDTVDDVIEPGAYRKTISTRRPKGIRSHDWDRFSSKALAYEELLPGDQQLPSKTALGEPWPRSAGAVKVLGQYNLGTKDGQEGFSNVGFLADEQEWSVGYNVERGHARMVKGVRHIDVMTEWYEWSDVLWGAMPLARGAELKSLGGMAMGGGLWLPEHVVKALPGSDEERRDMLEEALNVLYRSEHRSEDGSEVSGWQNIRATFPPDETGAGRVVTCFYADGERQDWEFEYRMVNGEVDLGERRAVQVVESLEADADPAADPEGYEEKDGEPALTADDLLEQAALSDLFTT